MGICDSLGNGLNKPKYERIVSTGFVPNEYIDKTSKSICKITYKNTHGTGFFMNYNSIELLVTNYHIIPEDLLNESIKLEFNDQINNKSIVLQKDKRKIVFFKPPLDVTFIQIIEEDEMDNVEYLDYDPDYRNGFRHYQQVSVFASGFPYGEKMQTGIGCIVNVRDNNYEFEHDIATDQGSSGSPIILSNNQKVIGVHKKANSKYNEGTFIGAIIDEMKKKN